MFLSSVRSAARTLFSGTVLPIWEPAALLQRLENQQYTELVTALNQHVDLAREPKAIDWCIQHGYQNGHVPVLYVLVRNMLKHQAGRVPTTEQTAFTFQCVLFLLLRVAQDVRCCHLDLAKSDRGFVYVVMRNKLREWISYWNPDTVPGLQALLPAFRQYCQSIVPHLPLPTWTAAFSCSVVGDTFYWNTPSSDDTTSFQRCQTTLRTRASVTRAFIEALRRQETLKSVLALELDDVS